jgi:DNA repair photolyase
MAQERGVFEPEGIDEEDEEVVPTTFIGTHPRTIVNRVDSVDLPFHWSLNPYLVSQPVIPVHVMIAPIIPTLNEPEVPALSKAAAQAGARTASYTVLRTNGSVEPVFRAWLDRHFPDRAAKVIAQTSSLHGGRMHDGQAGRRMKGDGPYASSIARLFHVLRKRNFGDTQIETLDRSQFSPPPLGPMDLFR